MFKGCAGLFEKTEINKANKQTEINKTLRKQVQIRKTNLKENKQKSKGLFMYIKEHQKH